MHEMGVEGIILHEGEKNSMDLTCPIYARTVNASHWGYTVSEGSYIIGLKLE